MRGLQWLAVVTMSAWSHAQPVLYVDHDSPAGGDGQSWATALVSLQDALSKARVPGSGVVEIRVAQGVYRPDAGAGVTQLDRSASFSLITGVSIKGGYAGVGTPDPDARHIDHYITELSGDLKGNDGNGPGSESDNSHHILQAIGAGTSGTVDGMRIVRGNASGNNVLSQGAGLLAEASSPKLIACRFWHNRAVNDGRDIRMTNGHLWIEGCEFAHAPSNDPSYTVYTTGGNPTVRDCVFRELPTGALKAYAGSALIEGTRFDRCNGKYGVCVLAAGFGDSILNDCVFDGNKEMSLSIDGAGVRLERCTFFRNSSTSQTAYVSCARAVVRECRFVQNHSYSFGGGLFLHPHYESFYCIGGTGYVKRLWSGQWEKFGTPSPAGTTYAFENYDMGWGTMFVASGLSLFSTPPAKKNIVWWDHNQWRAVGEGLEGGVFALESAIHDDASSLFATGSFTKSGATAMARIARWDGQAWAPLGSGLNGPGMALAWHDDGTDARLCAGGTFSSAGGVDALNIASWDGVQWSPLGAGLSGAVRALATYESGGKKRLYAAGDFLNTGALQVNRIASWNGTGWQPLSNGADDRINALAVHSGGLYAAGSFTHVGFGQVANRIARWNGSLWSSLTSGLDGEALTLLGAGMGAPSFASLRIGGAFQSAGGNGSPYFAQWTAPTWKYESLGSLNANVRTIGVSQGVRSTIEGCHFIGNYCHHNGGGCYADFADIVNCVFTGNFAQDGGAFAGVDVAFTNCTLVGNHALSAGGGLFVHAIDPNRPIQVSNTILWDNSTQRGGTNEESQMYVIGTSGPVSVDYSCVQHYANAWPGVGCIGTNPHMINPKGGDGIYGTLDDNTRLTLDSACIDAGSNPWLPFDRSDADGDGVHFEALPVDGDRHPRRIDVSMVPDTGVGPSPIVDIGAFEAIGFSSTDGPSGRPATGDCLSTALDWIARGDPRGDANGDGRFDWMDADVFWERCLGIPSDLTGD